MKEAAEWSAEQLARGGPEVEQAAETGRLAKLAHRSGIRQRGRSSFGLPLAHSRKSDSGHVASGSVIFQSIDDYRDDPQH
jgi:hypothetical protein